MQPLGVDAPPLRVVGSQVAAHLFLQQKGGTALFVEEQCYRYDDRWKVWLETSQERLKSLIAEDVRRLSPAEYPKLKPGQVRDIADMVRMICMQAGHRAGFDRWLDGREGEYVRLQNGILNIGTRELLPHSHLWFSPTALPFAYEPGARAPEFQAFLTSVWGGDEGLKRVLQDWLGYLLLSTTAQQRFAVFIGASRAGKGVLSRVITELLGANNCVSCTMTQLGGDFGLAPLVGKRVAFFHDAQKAQGHLGDLATERLISIVGQDKQPVNRKNRDIVTLDLPVKIVLVCNEIPAFINARGALTNRMLVFPFKKSFQGVEDPGLEGRLLGELPGILNWALEGAAGVAAGRRLEQAESGEATLDDIRKILDPLKAFVEERIQTVAGDEGLKHWVPVWMMYEAYLEWCRDNNHQAKSKNRFSMGLMEHLPAGAVRDVKSLNGKHERAMSHCVLLPKDVTDFGQPEPFGPGYDNVL